MYAGASLPTNYMTAFASCDETEEALEAHIPDVLPGREAQGP
jgi:hypothetical protein